MVAELEALIAEMVEEGRVDELSVDDVVSKLVLQNKEEIEAIDDAIESACAGGVLEAGAKGMFKLTTKAYDLWLHIRKRKPKKPS